MSQYYSDNCRQLHSRLSPDATIVIASASAQAWDHLYVQRAQQQPSHVESRPSYAGSGGFPQSQASTTSWQIDAYPAWGRTQLSNALANSSDNSEQHHLPSQGAYVTYNYGPPNQQPTTLERPQRHALPEAYIHPSADFQVQPSLLSTTSAITVATLPRQDEVAWDGGYLAVNSNHPDFGNDHYTPCEVAGREVDSSRQTSSDIRSPSLPATTAGIHAGPSSSPAPVKVEPDDPDGRFIMELTNYPSNQLTSSRSTPSSPSSNALKDSGAINTQPPPAEVPLRATQASKEMRRMMGVFRLNPFAMHSLSVANDDDSVDGLPEASAASWCGGEARPLEEEPVILEFQLDVGGPSAVDDGAEDQLAGSSIEHPSQTPLLDMNEAKLRSFSPGFELHSENIDVAGYHSERGYQSRNAGLIEEQRSPQVNVSGEGYCTRSDNDDSSTSQSVHTPRNDLAILQGALDQQHVPIIYSQPSHHTYTNTSPPLPSPSLWDGLDRVSSLESYPTTTAETTTVPLIPAAVPKGDVTHSGTPQRSSRLHTVTSHPYLRKLQQGSLSPPMYNPHAYMRQSQIFRSTSPEHSPILLNTPTHHTQPPQRGTTVYTPQGEEYFSSHRLLSSPRGTRNGGQQHESQLTSPPSLAPSQCVHGRRHGFTQPSNAYMRPGEYRGGPPSEGYPTTQTMQSSHLGQPAMSPSPVMPLASAYSDAQQQFVVGGPGPSNPTRRWSLPESSGRFNQVPFLGNP